MHRRCACTTPFNGILMHSSYSHFRLFLTGEVPADIQRPLTSTYTGVQPLRSVERTFGYTRMALEVLSSENDVIIGRTNEELSHHLFVVLRGRLGNPSKNGPSGTLTKVGLELIR